MELYTRIRQRREELHMTQDELAQAMGYKSRSSINKIELGKSDIPQSKIKSFAEALKTTPEYLMGLESNEITEDEYKEIFSRNLTRLLKKHHKSQKGVADTINVSPQTFNTWCKGIALPRMDKVQMLADYFGILKSDLIENKSNDKTNLTTSILRQARLLKKYMITRNFHYSLMLPKMLSLRIYKLYMVCLWH